MYTMKQITISRLDQGYVIQMDDGKKLLHFAKGNREDVLELLNKEVW